MSRAITDTTEGVLHRAVASEADRSRQAYRASFDHAASCAECNTGRPCQPGAELRRAWREARS